MYLNTIWDFLRLTNRCFILGSMVIADPDSSLLKILRKAEHLSFPVVSHRYPGARKSMLLLQHEIHFNPSIEVKCTTAQGQEEIAQKGNVKFYGFINQDNKHYVFIKMERRGTLHHFGTMKQRYVDKKDGMSVFETRREDQGHTPWEPHAKGRSQYKMNDHLLGDAVGLTYRPHDDSPDFHCLCEKDFLEFQQYSDEYPLCWNLSYSFLRHAVLVVNGLATGNAEMHKGILRHNMPKIEDNTRCFTDITRKKKRHDQ